MPLAFAPVGWAWLAVIALAAFFVLTAQPSSRQALWSAYFFGFGYFGVGASWVFISISQYGNGPVAAVLATAAFISLLALFPWSVAYLVRRPMSSTLEIIHKYHIISAQISAWEKPF